MFYEIGYCSLDFRFLLFVRCHFKHCYIIFGAIYGYNHRLFAVSLLFLFSLVPCEEYAAMQFLLPHTNVLPLGNLMTGLKYNDARTPIRIPLMFHSFDFILFLHNFLCIYTSWKYAIKHRISRMFRILFLTLYVYITILSYAILWLRIV